MFNGEPQPLEDAGEVNSKPRGFFKWVVVTGIPLKPFLPEIIPVKRLEHALLAQIWNIDPIYR